MVLTDKLNRAGTLAIASLLFLASLVPLLTREKAAAYGLLPSRSITMSTSQVSATNTTYHVRFDISTAASVGGIVVEFCDNSPIIGDPSCTTISGFDIGAPTVSGQSDGSGNDTIPDPVTGAAVADDCNLSTFTTAAELGGTNQTLALTAAAPVALATGATCFFDITTVTNPSTANHTFYGRIYTFSEAAEATGYTLADPNAGTGTVNDSNGDADNDDDYIDAGGIALSTAEQINITAKVQERLTFCVYTFPTVDSGGGTWVDTPSQADAGTGNDCGGKTGSDIILGDVNGVLDPGQSYVDKTSYFSITTNASGQAAVRMKGDTLKLTPGCAAANCRIEPIYDAAPGDNLPGLSVATREQFGMCLYKFDNSIGNTLSISNGTVPGDTDMTGATITAGDGGVNPGGTGTGCDQTTQSAHVSTAPVDSNGDGGTGHGGASFAFNTAALGSTYGQIIARKQAGGFTTARMAFLGNIDNTTEPGIYRTTLTFIATGTY